MGHTVVHLDCLFECLELEDVDDWGEDLVFDDGSIMRDLNDGRFNIVAGTFDEIATSEDLSTLLLNFDQSINIVLNSLLRVKRSN